MKLAVEAQVAEITDETRARISMVRPVLRATLFALKQEVVDRLGGYGKVTLADMARVYREGSGDCGICFEYAIHDAIKRRDPLLLPRMSEVLEDFCKIPGSDARSILFGAEKGKKLELLETDADLLTDDSRLLAGGRGAPVKLKAHLEKVKRAFRLPEERGDLPRSIRGLWRADLFVGAPSREQWVATTLKTNASQLEGGGRDQDRGLPRGASWRRAVLRQVEEPDPVSGALRWRVHGGVPGGLLHCEDLSRR